MGWHFFLDDLCGVQMDTLNRAISRNIGAGGGLLPEEEKILECTGWALKSSLTGPSDTLARRFRTYEQLCEYWRFQDERLSKLVGEATLGHTYQGRPARSLLSKVLGQKLTARTILESAWRMHHCSIPSVQMIALDRGTRFRKPVAEA